MVILDRGTSSHDYPEVTISGVPSPRFRLRKRLSCSPPGENRIIHGDNSAVLEELTPTLAARVRCVYIDPPYNNGDRYEHFLDRWSHEEWLKSISTRLQLLRPLLRADGSLWISIDDKQLHYLKVEADRVFGRENFVTTIVWEQRTTRENRKVFSQNHEYLLLYAKDAREFRAARNPLPAGPDVKARYRNPDNDSRGPWQSISVNVQAGHATATQFYSFKAPNGRVHTPPKGRCWMYTRERMLQEIAQGNLWFGRDGNGAPRLKRFLKDVSLTVTPETIWPAEEVGTSDLAKKHLLQMFPKAAVFETPKPEALIARVLRIATDPGDLVLDAYLGSGTTAAVAHKMGRHYIGIENGAQAITHCAKRLRMVVQGESSGVSGEVGWSGGGGFGFYEYVGPVG